MTTTSPRLALLVGINKYAAAGPTMSSCVNDVVDMEDLLKQRYQFRDEDIYVLLDCQATRKNIVDAFRNHLMARAAKDAIVVFYFAGHGSQFRDDGGDEPDGKDEVVLAYDSGTKGNFSITDDELHGLVDELSKTTKNSTFIFDSCHSGSIISKQPSHAQVISKGTYSPPKIKLLSRTVSVFQQLSANSPGRGPVLISGCRDDEESYIGTYGGVSRGTLTYNFTRILRSFGARNPSYAELMKQVCPAVHAESPGQNPLATGDVGRAAFGVEQPPFDAALAIEFQHGVLGVNAGSLRGITKGSRLEVLTATPPAGHPAKVEVTVEEVDPLQSVVRLVEGKLEQPVSLARLLAYAPSNLQHSVFAAESKTAAQAAITQRVTVRLRDAGYRLVDAATEAEFRLSVEADATAGTVRVGGRTAQVTSRPGEELADTLFEEVKHWTRWLSVLRRDNPNSRYQLKLKASEAQGPNGLFHPGDKATITVTNGGGPAFYGVVVVLSDDGRVVETYRHDAAPITAPWNVAIALPVPDNRKGMSYFVKVFAGRAPLELSSLGIDPAKIKAAESTPTPSGPDDWATSIAEIRVVR